MISIETEKIESELAFKVAATIAAGAAADKTPDQAFAYFVQIHSKIKDYLKGFHQIADVLNDEE